MLSKYVNVGNRVELQSVKHLNLGVPDSSREERKVYSTKVYDIISDERIELLMPMEQTKLILLPVDGEYELCFYADNGLYQFVPVTMGQFFAPGDYYTSIYQMAPHRVERYEDSKWYAEAGVLEPKSFQYLRDLAKMSNEDATEAANIYTELKKFMEESFTEFVKNGVTDASWNEFQETAKAIGVDEYIALYQAAYDEFLAK